MPLEQLCCDLLTTITSKIVNRATKKVFVDCLLKSAVAKYKSKLLLIDLDDIDEQLVNELIETIRRRISPSLTIKVINTASGYHLILDKRELRANIKILNEILVEKFSKNNMINFGQNPYTLLYFNN